MNDVLAFLAALDCRPSAVIVQTPDLRRVAYWCRKKRRKIPA
jgi:hypothetical protein